MDYLIKKQKGIVVYMAMKLDMYKAYDRIEWSFIQKMMLALGFPDKWNNLIMECITTITYPVKINGQIDECFKPFRSLR